MTYKTKKIIISISLLVSLVILIIAGIFYFKSKQFEALTIKSYPLHISRKLPHNFNIVGDMNSLHIKGADELNNITMKTENDVVYTGNKQNSIVSFEFGDENATKLELYNFLIKSDKNDKIKVKVDLDREIIFVRAFKGEHISIALNTENMKANVDDNPFAKNVYHYYKFPANTDIQFKLVPHSKRKHNNEWAVYENNKLTKKIIAE